MSDEVETCTCYEDEGMTSANCACGCGTIRLYRDDPVHWRGKHWHAICGVKAEAVAAEREACAKECERMVFDGELHPIARRCSWLIRERKGNSQSTSTQSEDTIKTELQKLREEKNLDREVGFANQSTQEKKT
jgi:hypothetical protein